MMMKSNSTIDSEIERRKFIKWISLSSLSLVLPFTGCNFESNTKTDRSIDITSLKNVFDFEKLSREVMGADALLYMLRHSILLFAGHLLHHSNKEVRLPP